MKLENDLTLEQFREEMQHRVVKYPLNSRPVKEALRFAKKHEDPAFYRIAADKIHAQRQFQRELYGPGRLERLIDFVALGSLREVVITLLLVAGGVVGLDTVKRLMPADPDSDLYAHMDVDELAARLGIVLEASNSTVGEQVKNSPALPVPESQGTQRKMQDGAAQRLSDTDIDRIADAVIRRLNNKPSGESVSLLDMSDAIPAAAREGLNTGSEATLTSHSGQPLAAGEHLNDQGRPLQ